MRKLLLFSLFIFGLQNAFGQIMAADTSAQTIAYWSKAESQMYKIEDSKTKVKAGDTLEVEKVNYSVDITVIDSTENSYTIEWFYHHVTIDSENLMVKTLGELNQDMIVRIKTNQHGVLQELVNWEEVRDHLYDGIDHLAKEKTLKEIPNWKKILKQTKELFSTKQQVQNLAIAEIQQFLFYHGGRYEQGEEYSKDFKSPNGLGGEPFDSHMTVWLDTVEIDNNSYILRSEQVINSEQLKKATYDYTCKTITDMGGEAPKFEDFPEFTNTTWIASRIHGTGWPLFSIKTKETKGDGVTQTEETTIELQ